MDIRKTWLFQTPIAHRGLHDENRPENSLASFENAVANQYPIELDIRPIDDGTVVVFHDDRLSRMTDNDGYVCNLTRAELAVQRLANTEEKIPTFEEVLSVVNGRTPILIEIKNEGKAGLLEKTALEMLKGYPGDFAVQAFNPFALEYFKHNAPEIMRGQLSCFYEGAALSRFKRSLLKKLKLNRVSAPDFISYAGANLPNKYVTRTGLPVLAWTVRSNTEMETVLPYCENIIFEGFIPIINRSE
ncbi:MAG: glycerophosphodiester phosphodiesterase [Clostridiales bacterium]|jgi:glycerophosphoryl diester phosphodiesterase|nr:glycerophosphodiester phosphodiesterase [Clostridiales bacterium]